MSEQPSVILSAFADECANRKTAIEQLAVMAALGLKYCSLRFIDVAGAGKIKHVVELSDDEYAQLRQLLKEYSLSVTSIGSRVGKVKLLDEPDGSHNKFVPLEEYVSGELARSVNAAQQLGSKIIRGFSFYHPQGKDPAKYVDRASDLVARMADECAKAGLIYGLEVEANLVGQNGSLLVKIAENIQRPNVVLVFDGGNLSSQNLSPLDCYREYRTMTPHLGWIHVKDYQVDPALEWKGVVDEERLKNFVPANEGDSGHELIFRDFRHRIPEIAARMKKLGAAGVFVEMEPHLKGGGQFGGFSGPDGMGVAVRAMCKLLDYSGIRYDLRTMQDIRESRGF